MYNTIIIDGWKCSLGPYDSRIALNIENETVSYMNGNLICYKPVLIPPDVLNWLLKPRDYFIWEEGGDWREKWGSDNWQEHNPYKK